VKRLAVCLGFLLAMAVPSVGAEEHGGDSVTLWKVANFVLLAGGLGYLIRKKGSAFFGARGREIRESIQEAARLKAEAEARAAEIEQRLANLGAAVEALRQTARRETAAEAERASARLRQEAEKIHSQAEQEIASRARTARLELRAYAADLAAKLAEQQIRARMTPETEGRLMGASIQSLGRTGGPDTEAGRRV